MMIMREIGLKFTGSLLLPFVCTKIVQAIFLSYGILPDFQMAHRNRVITVRRLEHMLKQIIEIDLTDRDFLKLSFYG